jgi:NAD(P)H-flavin reductase
MTYEQTLEEPRPAGFDINWYKILRKVRETADTYTLTMKPINGKRADFTPGQFNMLYSFGVGEVPISISGGDTSIRNLEHTIRAVGPVTKALTEKSVGEVVGVRGAFGNGWPLEEAMGNDVIIVAGGIGLAPLRPAIQYIQLNKPHYGQLYVLYGARTPADILYKRLLQSWGRPGTELLVTVDKAHAEWRGHIGVVTTLFRYVKLNPQNTYAFVCGPEIMMKFSVSELRNQGVPDEQIFISMERNMKCGVGICGHCQFGPFFICKDGPVLRYSIVKDFFGKKEV